MEQLYKLQGTVEEQSKHSAEFRDDVKGTLTEINNTIKNISEKIDEVKIQTTATNGRVISLETSRRGYNKVLFSIFGSILVIIGYIIVNAYTKK